MRKLAGVFLCLQNTRPSSKAESSMMNLFNFSSLPVSLLFLSLIFSGGCHRAPQTKILWTVDNLSLDYHHTKNIVQGKVCFLETKDEKLPFEINRTKQRSKMTCLDLDTGEKKWESDWADEVILPTSKENRSFTIQEYEENTTQLTVYSLEGRKEKSVWLQPLPKNTSWVSWFFHQEKLYAQSKHTLTRFNYQTGQIEHTLQLEDPQWYFRQDFKSDYRLPLSSNIWFVLEQNDSPSKLDQKVCRIRLSDLTVEACEEPETRIEKLLLQNTSEPRVYVVLSRGIKTYDASGTLLQTLPQRWCQNVMTRENSTLFECKNDSHYTIESRGKESWTLSGSNALVSEPYMVYWKHQGDLMLVDLQTMKEKSFYDVSWKFAVTTEFAGSFAKEHPKMAFEKPYIVFTSGKKMVALKIQ